jgi:hypothetical protein
MTFSAAYVQGTASKQVKVDIKCKTWDIQTWKKHLFLDIASTNIDTLVPPLYQCAETHGIEVF